MQLLYKKGEVRVLVKINNLLDANGQPDYKGLDISKFIGGSHIYDFEENTCIVETSEKAVLEGDVEGLTREQYDLALSSIPIPVDRIEELRKENEALKQSQADQDEIIMQLMLGGM